MSLVDSLIDCLKDVIVGFAFLCYILGLCAMIYYIANFEFLKAAGCFAGCFCIAVVDKYANPGGHWLF